MTSLLRQFAGTLVKMFVADFWLTVIALAVVALCALGLRTHLVAPAVLPFVLATGVLLALGLSIIRAARR